MIDIHAGGMEGAFPHCTSFHPIPDPVQRAEIATVSQLLSSVLMSVTADRNQRFADIWNGSPVFQQLRNPEALEGKCGDCRYQALCSGCRARASRRGCRRLASLRKT